MAMGQKLALLDGAPVSIDCLRIIRWGSMDLFGCWDGRSFISTSHVGQPLGPIIMPVHLASS